MPQAAQTTDTAFEPDVLYEVSDGIATITLNRPERMNTISRPMLDLLAQLLLKAESDPDARVVILTAKGRMFCAGLDLVSASEGKGIGAQTDAVRASIDIKKIPPTVLFNMDKPTICAINGAAAGYGMDTALGCDIRIMAESAKLAAAFVKRGIVPESGGTWFLPRMIGWAKASEIIFSGKTLTAAESLAMGLANAVVPDSELTARARAMAKEIASNAPLAVQASKRMMRAALSEGFNDHVQRVYLQLLPLFRTDDFREGIKSFVEKRPAKFEGR